MPLDRDGTRALIEVLLGHRTIRAPAIVAGLQATLDAGVVDPQVLLGFDQLARPVQ